VLVVSVSALALASCGSASEADPHANVTRVAQGSPTTTLRVTVSADPMCLFNTPPCGLTSPEDVRADLTISSSDGAARTVPVGPGEPAVTVQPGHYELTMDHIQTPERARCPTVGLDVAQGDAWSVGFLCRYP
jgi:hypothetical protein